MKKLIFHNSLIFTPPPSSSAEKGYIYFAYLNCLTRKHRFAWRACCVFTNF